MVHIYKVADPALRSESKDEIKAWLGISLTS